VRSPLISDNRICSNKMCENITSVLVVECPVLKKSDGLSDRQTDKLITLAVWSESEQLWAVNRVSCPVLSSSFINIQFNIERTTLSAYSNFCAHNYEYTLHIASRHSTNTNNEWWMRLRFDFESWIVFLIRIGIRWGLCQQERHTAHWLPLAAGQEPSTDADDGKPKVAVIWQLLLVYTTLNWSGREWGGGEGSLHLWHQRQLPGQLNGWVAAASASPHTVAITRSGPDWPSVPWGYLWIQCKL